VDRSPFARWVAPVAFLAAITIGVLVVRAGFEHGKHHAKSPPTTTNSKKKAHGHHHAHRQTYTIQTGDTLASIAAKNGTTVARLEQLNPGIDPAALQVGNSIRVK
jgi:LysM repeat protein